MSISTSIFLLGSLSLDPFASHGELFYTPPDHVGILSSPFLKESEDLSLVNQPHSKLDYIKPPAIIQDNDSDGDPTPCPRRRQFCGCKKPCSNYVSISHTTKSFATIDHNSMHIDPLAASSWVSDNTQRRGNIGNISLRTHLSRRTLLGRPVLGGLELVLPKFSVKPWEEDLTKPFSETGGNVAESSAAFRLSNVYDSWMSSWCFHPAIVRSKSLPLTEILVPSSPQLGFDLVRPFLSPQLSSQELDIRKSSVAIQSRGSDFLSPPVRILARNSRVVSGVSKLRNLRDLLLTLDQNWATSAIHTSQFSDGQLHEL